ncbi:MAG: hypothetical protein FJY82_08175 [Candidatus Aminicenantes bacterium]|nr:hypothetical protein [Candidatus Aminicenantes bacterium]
MNRPGRTEEIGRGPAWRPARRLVFGVFIAALFPAIAAEAEVTSRPAQTKPAAQLRANVDLEALLKKTAEYCRKLENAALDFICREEISEKIDPTYDGKKPAATASDWVSLPGGRWIKGEIRSPKILTSYIYDYQCVRAGGEIRENRTLLSENGKKINEPNARLKTAIFVFGSVLLSPVGLLAKRFQGDCDYAIVGTEKIARRLVVILEAKPKSGAPETTNLFGKAWIDSETADILKIEWDKSRVRHHESVEKFGERIGWKPRLTIRSEFSAEKNGIRFPTRFQIQEAYLNERGRAFVRSETNVVYKDFKFFTVEVDVR